MSTKISSKAAINYLGIKQFCIYRMRLGCGSLSITTPEASTKNASVRVRSSFRYLSFFLMCKA